ncbi:MAG TPA: alanine--tRNA ligase-related protein [Ktedonobacteraceae bacterium]|nr:alanine--tRNA ligase-related protein [Ktedonobacteraceae bacterium]
MLFSDKDQIIGLVVDGQEVEMISAPQSALLLLDSTPFYAESGGQIGDRGEIESSLGMFQVQDTRKPIKGLIVHYGKINEGYLRVGGCRARELAGKRLRALALSRLECYNILEQA